LVIPPTVLADPPLEAVRAVTGLVKVKLVWDGMDVIVKVPL